VGFLFFQVLDLGSPQHRNPPWGELFTIKLGGVPRTGGSRMEEFRVVTLVPNPLRVVRTGCLSILMFLAPLAEVTP